MEYYSAYDMEIEKPASNLLAVNKILNIGRWALEILTVTYILSIIWSVQPGWQAVEGLRREFVDTFLAYFPFNDVQLTWMMTGLFGILIFVKSRLFKTTDFYESKGKFLRDIATMVFWIAFCAAWLIITAMGVVGEVFHWFNFIPYEWIPILNYLF